jgi:hypothetical protein
MHNTRGSRCLKRNARILSEFDEANDVVSGFGSYPENASNQWPQLRTPVYLALSGLTLKETYVCILWYVI